MCVTMITIIYVYIYKSEHVSLRFHNHDYIKIEDVNVSLPNENPSPCWNIKYNIQYITASTSQLCIGQCRSRYTISLIIEEAQAFTRKHEQ
jgi:hypothetical protein